MITLDIEDSSIKIMEVKGRRVKLAASSDLEPGLVEDGVIIDKERVSQQIKELVSTHHITEKKIVASISGIHSIYRLVRMPKLSGRLLNEAATREISRVMPVPLHEIYTAWQVVTLSAVESVVCLVGLPRTTVDTMMETLRLAGLEARIMDVSPLAAARIADEANALIINVKAVSFDIVVMIQGIPELIRSLPFTSKDMSLAEKVEEIKGEVDRTVSFYNSSHKQVPVTDDIYAFVSGEQREAVAEQLSYTVKPLPEVLSYPEDIDPNSYAVNIGLALKQIKINESRIRININASPVERARAPRPITEVAAWVFVVAAIAVLVLTFISVFRALDETAALQSQVDIMQSRIQARQGTEEEIQKLQAELNKVRGARDVFLQPLDNLAEQRAEVNDYLGEITSLMPGIVVPDSITYQESSAEEDTKEYEVIVDGIAPDEATILAFSNALRETEKFKRVTVSYLEVADYNEVAFTLTLTIGDE